MVRFQTSGTKPVVVIFRHKLYYAGLSMRPGCRAITTDACVPISKLPEMLIKTREDIDKAGLTGKVLIFKRV